MARVEDRFLDLQVQLGPAGDFADGFGQERVVLALRVAAARSELLRVAQLLVLVDPRSRLQELEVSGGDGRQRA